MIHFLIAVGLLAQGAAPKKAADTALLDELIARTNEVQHFVAVYAIHTSGMKEEKSMRITFRAPDDLRLDLQPFTVFSLRNGVMDIRLSPPDEKAQFARVALGDIGAERARRLAEAVALEFPSIASTWSAKGACGGQLQMRITPAAEADKENFEFRVEYVCPRGALCGWLDTFRRWPDARTEDAEHVVFQSARGTQLSLSKKTGFIDAIVKEKTDGTSTFKLETLDLNPTLAADAFELGAPPAGAVDASAGFSAQMQRVLTFSGRRGFLSWISSQVADHKIEWDADARSRAGKVLEVVHADGITLENAPWIAHTEAWMDGLAGWLREGFAQAETGDFEQKVADARKKLLENVQSLLRSRPSGFPVDEADVPYATLRASLGDLEAAAMQSAFERAVQRPLLDKFDEAVQRAKRGG